MSVYSGGGARYNISGGSGSRARSVGRPEQFYPSPFFDVAQNYLPKNIKETFSWCQYYQLTNPLISAVTQKLSTYPITDLIYEDDNQGVVDLYKTMFEKQFLLRQFLIETNLDRYTYGNSFVSVSFPFKKILTCKSCGEQAEAKRVKYKWKAYTFHMDCPSCGHSGPAKATDEHIKSPQQIKLIRWNPKNITIKYNELTGHSQYYYSMPRHIKNDILLGKPATVESVPQAFIESLRRKKTILIESDMLFHARRPSISRDPADSGWGAPLILPVLKDIFFLQVLRKAQEAVALEHIVPMRVMFPQVTTDGNNPYANINLEDWQKEVTGQIKKWRQDNNYIPVMPVPIGYQMIGGQGRSLLLHQELRVYNDQIIAGMGVPTGFFYGEQQYSGASVNLRALENEFLGNRQDMLRLVEFVRDKCCAFLDIPKIKLRFKPFKMADDIQRASFDLNLANAGFISKRTFLESRDFNFENEQDLLQAESGRFAKLQRENMIRQTEAQGESMLIQTRYQTQSQAIQQEAQAQMAANAPQPPPGAAPQQGGPQGGPPQQGAPPQQQGGAPQQGGEQAQGMMPPGGGQQDPSMMGAPTEGQMPPQQPQGDVGGIAQSPIGAGGGGTMVDLFAQAKSLTSQVKKMGEVDRYRALAQLRASNPDLYMLVNNALTGQGMKPMSPLPEQRPPRAGADSSQI
jgi:hypothetical protein